jgi:hypothetical protein
MSPTTTDPALPLVHEGWDHLKHERPLAAWASWRRALQINPDQAAAKAALERLANAPDLPASARREYRFRPPAGEARRSRWDAKLRDRDLSDLAAAASAFAELAAEDPTDPDSAYNAGLCCAWIGRNELGFHHLSTAADRIFSEDQDVAIQAALLAEILRQGLGVRIPFERQPDQTEAIELTEIDDPEAVIEAIGRHATLRRIPSPVDPSVDASRGTVTVAEILDRPWPEPREIPLPLDEVPRVVAVVLGTGSKLRFSSVAGGLETVQNLLLKLGIEATPTIESPLPLALVDAAVWLIRLPDWVDEETRQRLYRENVEDYYENRWIVSHRIGQTPASWEFALGETPEQPGLRARLEAMIRLREELAARPSSIALYQGYPFDRLRHRLGLPPRDPAAIDPIEIGFMTGVELDSLDLATLDDHAVADAYRSAVPLQDNARAARFAEELVRRRAEALRTLDLPNLFRYLFKPDRPRNILLMPDPATEIDTLIEPDQEDRVAPLAQAIEIDAMFQGGRNRLEFDVLLATEFARLGQREKAGDLFESVLGRCDFEHLGAGWTDRYIENAERILTFHEDLFPPDRARKLAETALEIARERNDAASVAYFETLIKVYAP